MAGEMLDTVIVVAQAEIGEGAEILLDGAASEGELIEGTEAHAEEEHSEVFPPFDPSTFGPQLFWLALTFGVLYLLMSRLALPRIGEILEVRRDRIESDLAEAERLRQKTDQAIEAYETALAEARAKANAIAGETRDAIKADLAGKRQTVETELSQKMASAEQRIQQTKTEALANVDAIAAETASAIVEQITGKVPIKTARDAVSGVIGAASTEA